MNLRYVHWKDGDHFIGYWWDYPDYLTQGASLQDLKDHLLSLYSDILSGELPYIKKVDELAVPG